MKEKSISVIITSYNQKDYLIETVESVINQTTQPYEILVADDYSTDGSVKVIQDYMEKYPDLVKGIFQKQNVGIPRNRNSACEAASGNYISILDGDDLFYPYTINRITSEMESYPRAKGVYSNISYIDARGNYLGIRDIESNPSGNIFNLVALGRGGLLRSMVMDRSLMQEVGFLNPNLPKYDGFELTAKLAKKGDFAYIPEPLVKKREHSASDSKSLQAADHIHDLKIIYQTVLNLSSDLPSKERKRIDTKWKKRLFKWQLRRIQEKIRF